MYLIKHEDGDDKFNYPRWIYATENNVIKIFPAIEQTSEGLHEQCELINYLSGVELIESSIVEDGFIKISMKKMQYGFSDLYHSSLDDIKFILKQFINITLKLYPYAMTDVSKSNMMKFENNIVFIDWDDVLCGNKHTPEYIVTSHLMNTFHRHPEHKDEIIQFYRDETVGTVLELNHDEYETIACYIKNPSNEQEVSILYDY